MRGNSLVRIVCGGAVLYVVISTLSQSTKDWTYITPQFSMDDLLSQSFQQLPTSTRASIPHPDDTRSHFGESIGVISNKESSFFRKLQDQVDADDPATRCSRYGAKYNPALQRRIFYGSLIADESSELLEVVAAESYGIYHAMVFVEANRTQNFTPRTMRHVNQTGYLQDLFHAQHVQMREYINEKPGIDGMYREHLQRGEILKGWKELGMTDDDLGLLADTDETFTRDFLRAVQTCDFDLFDIAKHDCAHSTVKTIATTLVFESSPECPVSKRSWFHPDIIVGHCIESISSHHPPAPRTPNSFLRKQGYGSACTDWQEEDKKETLPHSWDAADFRRTCGGKQIAAKALTPNHNRYTGFHLHNWFAGAHSIRFKYRTYGHFDVHVEEKSLGNISNDLHLMVHCIKGEEDHDEQTWKRVVGGYDTLQPPLPIYFQDDEYRRRRHTFMQELVAGDERERREKSEGKKLPPKEVKVVVKPEPAPEKVVVKPAPALEKVVKPEAALEKEVVKPEPGKKPESTKPKAEPQRDLISTQSEVAVTDPSLYTSVITGDDSSSATVMALASGYRLDVYQRFVGSLRKTGYKGHIILGVAPDIDRKSINYLKSRNVDYKLLRWVNCTYDLIVNDGKPAQCAYPYSDIKTRWSRFPLARDWLAACSTCTGPVLVMDARDSLFQRDPFANTNVTGLHVFQEHLNQTTQHWLAKIPIEKCKGVTYHETMLCSGTTVGTRAAMLKYLDIMYLEMRQWIVDTKCHFQMNGDDQSIHNYLFYSGQLPFANSVPNRHGGIVNTAGVEGAVLANRHFAYWKEKEGLEKPQARLKRYAGATDRTWIGPQFNVANEDGLFTELDGSISRVVHQWDRFHFMYETWLQDQRWASDRFVEEPESLPIESPPKKEEKPEETVKGRHLEELGIDVSDPELYATTETGDDSSSSTVIGLAAGYDLSVYRRFVGSLRKTGYTGHIILGVAENINEESRRYLSSRNVVLKVLKRVKCTYDLKLNTGEEQQCADPYSDIKTRWSRFPLSRDWLAECSECTGPVIVMDTRDSVFQRDPFANTNVTGLQVFQEHKNVTTENWLTQWPISSCKGQSYVEPMLCSGTTVGTRAAMLKYLEIMYAEMKKWIVEPKCRFDIDGDDQSIHNYLYYSGQLPFATSVPNRRGGIVNTIGYHGSSLANAHFGHWKSKKGLEKWDAKLIPYPGANAKSWIGPEFMLTDENGLFTEFDGSISRVVHQWDRFHFMYENWLERQPWAHDVV